jgi:mono/diheme cytochrome c family protein
MIVQADTTLATNTIAIGFGAIDVSALYPDFNPTTYARLTSTNVAIPIGERVFANRCAACHGASGNLSLAAANLGTLKATGRVVPFAPNSSLIHARMALPAGAAGVMPQAGPVPADELRFVRDWILDGAPP